MEGEASQPDELTHGLFEPTFCAMHDASHKSADITDLTRETLMFQRPDFRKQFFVDRQVQGRLVLRVILYGLTLQFTVFLLTLCWQMACQPPRPFYMHLEQVWRNLAPAMLASWLILPLVVLDIIRVSNRFAGPLLRVRRALRALANGEDVQPLRFRCGDFWQDFAEDFNRLVARHNERGNHSRDEEGVPQRAKEIAGSNEDHGATSQEFAASSLESRVRSMENGVVGTLCK